MRMVIHPAVTATRARAVSLRVEEQHPIVLVDHMDSARQVKETLAAVQREFSPLLVKRRSELLIESGGQIDSNK